MEATDQGAGSLQATGAIRDTGEGAEPAVAGTGAFGPNAWLVEDMYDRYRVDPTSVSESWREFFADYRPPGTPPAPTGALTRELSLIHI